MPQKQRQLKFDNVESVRDTLIDIVTYIKSLDAKNITQNTKNELLKIHEDYYRLVDAIDEKLQLPRIPREWRIKV
jgi:glutaredoxin 2